MTYSYPRLNLSRIREKVADIRENVEILKCYAVQDQDIFLSNKEAVRSARYAFIVMIEASCNIANHLCAKLLNNSPESYAECFIILGNNDLITKDLAQRLGKMAGFRNLLVHGYAEIDDKKMYDIMQNNLEDIESWLKELDLLLEKKKSEGDGDG